MKKKRNPLLKEYDLVPETAGKICNGVYKSKDGDRLIIQFAWGDNLYFGPQDYLKIFPLCPDFNEYAGQCPHKNHNH